MSKQIIITISKLYVQLWKQRSATVGEVLIAQAPLGAGTSNTYLQRPPFPSPYPPTYAQALTNPQLLHCFDSPACSAIICAFALPRSLFSPCLPF